jgi:DNA polymerase
MNKQIELNKLAKEIEKDDLYKEKFIGKMVFGEGNVDAKIMFVGEAPGKQEAESGRPFIGRSGKLLRSYITGIGLKEADVYITSPVKYLPAHGTPTPKEIERARVHFFKQVDIIQPKLLVLLGKTALYAALNESLPILKHHGEIREKDGRHFFLTLHPAAVLRFSKFKPFLEADFQKLKEFIKKNR